MRGNTLETTMKTYFILTFLLSLCNVILANFPGNSINSLIAHYNIRTTNFMNESTCTGILDEFADAASKFTNCSIRHARPVSLCAECIDQYVTFYDTYQKLITNDTCKSSLISNDRLDAVVVYHDNILDVWIKGNCNGCFDWDQGKPKLSNNTQLFKDMLNETRTCINDSLNQDPHDTKQACKNCMTIYVKLDEFYKHMSDDSIGVDTVCMDIVDSMNATRFVWSKILDCCNLRRTPEIVFLCCSAFIASLPILFYVAVRFYGPIRDLPNVLKQSRFKQVILRSSEGRIN